MRISASTFYRPAEVEGPVPISFVNDHASARRAIKPPAWGWSKRFHSITARPDIRTVKPNKRCSTASPESGSSSTAVRSFCCGIRATTATMRAILRSKIVAVMNGFWVATVQFSGNQRRCAVQPGSTRLNSTARTVSMGCAQSGSTCGITWLFHAVNLCQSCCSLQPAGAIPRPTVGVTQVFLRRDHRFAQVS